jgi:hypothetical protein
MQVHTAGAFAEVDFAARTARLARRGETIQRGGLDVLAASAEEQERVRTRLFTDPDLLPLSEAAVEDRNALLDEQREFAASILERRAPRVSGRQGLAALEAAERVLAEIAAHQARCRTIGAPTWPQWNFAAPSAPSRRQAA